MSEPDRQVLEKLLPGVTTSAIHDVLTKRHAHPCTIIDLITPTPDRVLFGPAATIHFLPYRHDLGQKDFARAYYRAVGDSAAGKVLVMSCGGYPDGALAGGKKMTRAAFQGAAGVLTDGRLRDLDDLARAGLVIHCNGEAVVPANTLLTPEASNIPIQVRGVTVIPGDWVYADGSGAVIIPGSVVEQVLHEAAELEVADVAVVERSRDEQMDREAHR
ncbi:MAG: RraA family protein [Thermoleophilia bacterium]|nr:RraA family protein [Thermoleophilia bacterium]